MAKLRRASPEPQKLLSAACRQARAQELRAALKRGADPNKSGNGWTPLAALIQEDVHDPKSDAAGQEAARVECARVLLEAGADPELRSGFPPAPALVLAALGGKRKLVQVVVDHHAKRGVAVDDFAAAALGELARLKKRLAQEPALAQARDAAGLTLLHHACGSRMGAHDAKLAKDLLRLVELLIECGAEVNACASVRKSDLAPSYFAISARRFDETRLLLERGADANDALGTAMWNTKEEFPRFGELCLAHGAKIDAAVSDGKPLLNQLVRWGQFKQSRWLLEKGGSPNRRDERGWTATHQAATRGNKNFWGFVRAHGGDVTLAADGGITPGSLARVKGLPVE